MFGTILSSVIMGFFLYFWIKNREQRLPIFTLMVIGVFWIYFGGNLAHKITDISGVLLYYVKAVTDLFSAILFMVLHINTEDENKDKFPLCKYLAYIFWANFAINFVSAIEYSTTYTIMYNMYGGLVTLLNIAQVMILFKKVQDYASKPRGFNFLHVFNRADHHNSDVGIPEGIDSSKIVDKKASKK